VGWLDGVDDTWDITFISKLGISREIVSFYDDSDGPWEDDDED
jgi:hypothetical protein